VTISRFWLGKIPGDPGRMERTIAEDVSDPERRSEPFKGDRLQVEQVSWADCQHWLKRPERIRG